MTNKTNNVVSDDLLTINQATKRLGDRAPSRQTLYNAVKAGKIESWTSEGGKLLVSEESVLRFVESDASKPRRKSRGKENSATKESSETSTLGDSDSTELNTKDDTLTVSAAVTPIAGENAPLEKAPEAGSSAPPRAKRSRDGKANASAKGPSIPSIHAGSTPKEISKPREKMRSKKNHLRGLSFEETKEIRDWLDNRLLHVIRPVKETTEA